MVPSELFLIDGKPMLLPDENMELSFEDLDSASAGRDESGVMHRIMVRQKVGKWGFVYSRLTQEEYAYMEGLFQGKASFQFTFPSLEDRGKSKTVTAYRASHGISWRNAKTGEFCSYKFSIIEC